MVIADYIVNFLINRGVTDAFGLPGGAILDFIYALDAQKNHINAHLCYHEQSAGFAACGYAQSSGKLGVAYATKGPGFTNLITAIADAYYDSIPVLFITAHSTKSLPCNARTIDDQEMDTCSMVRNITKYAVRIDNIEDVEQSIHKAYHSAMEGRKGPVFIDIATQLFKATLPSHLILEIPKTNNDETYDSIIDLIQNAIKKAKRPIILIGDGINQVQKIDEFNKFIGKARIPVLSSRYSHNIVHNNSLYFGYIGSHGIRYANFILSKADLIITIGNRLSFPVESDSYSKIIQQAHILRLDIDNGELERHTTIKNQHTADIAPILTLLSKQDFNYGNHQAWLQVCDLIKENLYSEDTNLAVDAVAELLRVTPKHYTLVCDVGNNEFWVSRACVRTNTHNRTLYSKSFGALGNALGKAIGTYYATGQPVIVFIGDQGFMLNIQELQYIHQHNLPIMIVLMNNQSSGMIKDRESATNKPYYLHTTLNSGYSIPNFKSLTNGFNISHFDFKELHINETLEITSPVLVEVCIDANISLTPSLPKGNQCQNMTPNIDIQRYNYLNEL